MDKVIEEFKQKYQLIRNDCLLTEKHTTNRVNNRTDRCNNN
jgi:hypothetical protein